MPLQEVGITEIERKFAMGLSSNARLLTITAKLTNNEYETQKIANRKLALSTLSQTAQAEYNDALDRNILIWNGFDTYGAKEKTPLTVDHLYQYQSCKQQYMLANTAGNVYVKKEDADNFEQTDNLKAFLDRYHLFDSYNAENSAINTQYENEFNAEHDAWNIKNTEYETYLQTLNIWKGNRSAYYSDLATLEAEKQEYLQDKADFKNTEVYQNWLNECKNINTENEARENRIALQRYSYENGYIPEWERQVKAHEDWIDGDLRFQAALSDWELKNTPWQDWNTKNIAYQAWVTKGNEEYNAAYNDYINGNTPHFDANSAYAGTVNNTNAGDLAVGVANLKSIIKDLFRGDSGYTTTGQYVNIGISDNHSGVLESQANTNGTYVQSVRTHMETNDCGGVDPKAFKTGHNTNLNIPDLCGGHDISTGTYDGEPHNSDPIQYTAPHNPSPLEQLVSDYTFTIDWNCGSPVNGKGDKAYKVDTEIKSLTQKALDLYYVADNYSQLRITKEQLVSVMTDFLNDCSFGAEAPKREDYPKDYPNPGEPGPEPDRPGPKPNRCPDYCATEECPEHPGPKQPFQPEGDTTPLPLPEEPLFDPNDERWNALMKKFTDLGTWDDSTEPPKVFPPGAEPKQKRADIYTDDKEKAQWYINLWYRMGGSEDVPKLKTKEDSNIVEDYFRDNYLFSLRPDIITKGKNYEVIDSNLAKNSNWIASVLGQGTAILQRVDVNEDDEKDEFRWSNYIHTNAAEFTTKSDDEYIARAEAKYNQIMDEITTQDQRLQIKMKKLDTEHNALKTEYESLQNIVSKNIERSFKTFA